jgi:hypothetical protein
MVFNPFSPDWPKQTADAIDKAVQKVRTLFTARAVTLTNGIVFGLLAAFAGLIAAIISVVVGIRAVQAYLTWNLDSPAAWVIGIIALAGALALLIGLVTSKKALLGLGAVLLVGAGARWALDAGDASIDHDTSVWISYFVVGGLFVLIGSYLMAKRHSPLES